MTPDEMLKLADEAEQLAAAANPGPWTYEPPRSPRDPMGHCIVSAARYAVAAMMMTCDLDDDLKEQASKNGPFIAASRTLVPQLAGALREVVKRLQNLERQDVKIEVTGAGVYVVIEGYNQYLHANGQWKNSCLPGGYFKTRAEAEAVLAASPPPPRNAESGLSSKQ